MITPAFEANHFRLRSNVWHSILAFLANTALAFWTYRIVIKTGGVEMVGLWATLQAWLYVARFGDLGIGATTARFLAALSKDADEKEQREIIDTALIANSFIFLILAIFGYLGLSLTINIILPSDSTSADISMAYDTLPVLCAAFFLQGITQPILGSLQGLHLGYLAARIGVVGVVVQLLLAIILIPKLALEGFALAQVGQSIFLILIAWLIVVKQTAANKMQPLPLGFSTSKFKDVLQFSIRLQMVNLANGFFEPVSKFVVGQIGGLAALGVFELAYRTVQLPRAALATGILATLPTLTNLMAYDLKGAHELYKLTIRRVNFSIFGIGAAVAAGAPIISIFWLGGFNANYLWTVLILTPGIAGNMLAAPAYVIGISSGRLRFNFASAIIAILGLLALAWPLTHIFGPQGSIVAISFCLLVGGLYLKYMVEQKILYET